MLLLALSLVSLLAAFNTRKIILVSCIYRSVYKSHDIINNTKIYVKGVVFHGGTFMSSNTTVVFLISHFMQLNWSCHASDS